MKKDRASIWPFLQAFLTPPRCPLCQTSSVDGVCGRCRQSLPWLTTARCPRCAHPHPNLELSSHTCGACLRDPPSFFRAEALFRFEGPVRAQLHAAKFGRSLPALQTLAALASERIDAAVREIGPDLIVPMPLSWPRLWRRGFNQSRVLLELVRKQALSRTLAPWPPVETALKRRHRRAQAQSKRGERLRALRGVFRASGARLAGARVLVLDDVLTTGATADAASAALLKAGAREVAVLVLARAVEGV